MSAVKSPRDSISQIRDILKRLLRLETQATGAHPGGVGVPATHAGLPDVTADQHHTRNHSDTQHTDGPNSKPGHPHSYTTTSEATAIADAEVAAHEAASDPHAGYQKESEKAAASGYASLDAGTKVPTAQLGGSGADNTKFLRGDQTWAVPSGAALTVKEIDGTPNVSSVTTIRFTNGTVTDDGSGQVTVDVGGSGGGGAASFASIWKWGND